MNKEEKRRYHAITGAVYVSLTSHPLRHFLRDQPCCEGHVQARESSHGGGQASASLVGGVHRLFYHLQAERLQTCCLFGC